MESDVSVMTGMRVDMAGFEIPWVAIWKPVDMICGCVWSHGEIVWRASNEPAVIDLTGRGELDLVAATHCGYCGGRVGPHALLLVGDEAKDAAAVAAATTQVSQYYADVIHMMVAPTQRRKAGDVDSAVLAVRLGVDPSVVLDPDISMITANRSVGALVSPGRWHVSSGGVSGITVALETV